MLRVVSEWERRMALDLRAGLFLMCVGFFELLGEPEPEPELLTFPNHCCLSLSLSFLFLYVQSSETIVAVKYGKMKKTKKYKKKKKTKQNQNASLWAQSTVWSLRQMFERVGKVSHNVAKRLGYSKSGLSGQTKIERKLTFNMWVLRLFTLGL